MRNDNVVSNLLYLNPVPGNDIPRARRTGRSFRARRTRRTVAAGISLVALLALEVYERTPRPIRFLKPQSRSAPFVIRHRTRRAVLSVYAIPSGWTASAVLSVGAV